MTRAAALPGTNDFRSSKPESDRQQARVMEYMRQKGCKVEDKRFDSAAQAAGIDFVINGSEAEFKACNQIGRTGNMAFEIISNTRKGTPGGALRSQAVWLFYLDALNDRLHVVSIRNLMLCFERSDQTVWKSAKSTTASNDGGILYATVSLLFPIAFVRQVQGYRMYDLKNNTAGAQAAAN